MPTPKDNIGKEKDREQKNTETLDGMRKEALDCEYEYYRLCKKTFDDLCEKLGRNAMNDLIIALDIEFDGIQENGYIEVKKAKEPKGDRQYGDIKSAKLDASYSNTFTDKYVNQTTNGGITGDMFAGSVYLECKLGRFEIPYHM